MKKIILNTLILFTFLTATATEQHEDVRRVNFRLQSPDHFYIQCAHPGFIRNVHRSTLEQLTTLHTMLGDSGDYTNTEPIYCGFPQKHLEIIIKYIEEEPSYRLTHLFMLPSNDLDTLIHMADFYKLSNKKGAYTDLMEYVLTTFSTEELKELKTEIGTELDPEATQKALKKMQLAALTHESPRKRCLSHPENLGSKKIAFLRNPHATDEEQISASQDENFCAKTCQLTIQDMYTYEIIEAALPETGQPELDLNDRYISCVDGFQDLELYAKIGDVVMENFFQYMTLLNLSDNKITALAQFTFSNLAALESIDLQGNEIRTVAPRTFCNLPALKRVHLNNNRLTKIESTLFDNVPELELVALHENEITELRALTFDGLPQLHTVHLNNNRIVTVAPTAFNNVPQLRWIDLSNNRIAQLVANAFSDLLQLKDLNLARNELSLINGAALVQLPQLTTLDLKHNHLTDLHPSTFAELPALTTVNLESNQLTELHPALFSQSVLLRIVTLKNNRIKRVDHAIFTPLIQLRKLYLENNLLSEKEKTMLRQNIPADCHIHF